MNFVGISVLFNIDIIIFSLSSSSLLLFVLPLLPHLSFPAAVNLGTVLTLLAHAMFAFLGNSTFIGLLAMIIMGVAYSLLACALWPLVALIMPEHQLGTAYGMYVCVCMCVHGRTRVCCRPLLMGRALFCGGCSEVAASYSNCSLERELLEWVRL